MGRSPCCSKDSVNRGAWSAYEDSLLTKYIEAHGEGGWRFLPKKAGLKRCGKSCRLRWLNYLRPNIKRGNISADEEELIIRMHGLLGNRWSLIAGRVPGRTDNEIKNYWNTYLSKKLGFKGLHHKTRKPVLDSHDHNEAKAAKMMAPRCIKPINSKWATRSGSMPLQILDDHDQKKNWDSPQQLDLNYHPSVLDDQCIFLPSSAAQINDDPSSYTNPPDFNCSNTLMAGPDDNLIDVEVISSRSFDAVILSSPPEAPNLTSVDQLHVDSVSLLNSTCDFSQSSDMPETGNDLSYFRTTVPDLHEQTVTPHVKIDCPLEESADQINTNISSNTFLPALAPSDDNSEINVHADQKNKFQEVLNFFEVEVAEKEMCCNRLDPDWGQDHTQHLKADATSASHTLMDQLHWDGHESLQIEGDLCGSCSLDYGLIDGSMWEASLWH